MKKILVEGKTILDLIQVGCDKYVVFYFGSGFTLIRNQDIMNKGNVSCTMKNCQAQRSDQWTQVVDITQNGLCTPGILKVSH